MNARGLEPGRGLGDRVGARAGNSGYTVRPGYCKFLHFIVSSPQQGHGARGGTTAVGSGANPSHLDPPSAESGSVCYLGGHTGPGTGQRSISACNGRTEVDSSSTDVGRLRIFAVNN